MTFFSIQFILFLAVFFLIYYLVPKRVQWITLLIGSVIFYCLCSTPYTILYLLITITSIYVSAKTIQRQTKQIEKSGGDQKRIGALQKKRRLVFIAALAVNIGLLGVLKYTNFFLTNTQRLLVLFNLELSIPSVHWIASLGISFYTFQAIGYLTDVYWGMYPAEERFLKLALFLCYFPQLTTGPISRYPELRNQLCKEVRFDYRAFCFGAQRILWGYFKKLVISENLAPMVSTIYGNPHDYPGFYIWMAMGAFALQLYTDFSGSIDILLGISECFGIALPENFRNPFFSTSIQEFWQRWHITLGQWFRDYLMYPILKSSLWFSMGRWLKKHVSKKHSKQIPTFLGMLVLWTAIGLWHGDGWSYVVQGWWFGAIIVLSELFQPLFSRVLHILRINTSCMSWKLFQSLRTFVIFSIGLVFFRAPSVSWALSMLGLSVSVFNPHVLFSSDLVSFFGDGLHLFILFLCVAVLLTAETMQVCRHHIRESVGNQNLLFRWGLYYLLFFSIVLFGKYGSGYSPSDFIYGGF